MSLVVLLVLLAIYIPGSASSEIAIKGIVYGSGGWSSPNRTFASSYSDISLTNLANTGAGHVRIIVNWYQDDLNATKIYPLRAPSPLRTATDDDLRHGIAKAQHLGLKVLLAPVIDPNWDLQKVDRDSRGSHHGWRGQIGGSFTSNQWQAWFQSYSDMLLHYAHLAQTSQVSMFEMASELNLAFAREQEWRTLVSKVRQVYNGSLTLAAGQPFDLTWWDALDIIGHDAYGGKGDPENISVRAQRAAWQPRVDALRNLSKHWGKPVLVTEIGYQSRPSCTCPSANCLRYDQGDCSGWLECYDMDCQANAYEAFLRAFTESNDDGWWLGVFWWLWRTDPTEGGTSDHQFTPAGKPAEQVLRRYYGATKPPLQTVAQAVANETLQFIRTSAPAGQRYGREHYNGYVLGGPDEWSYPGIRFDSPEAAASLKLMHQAHANSVEIPVMWYYDNNAVPDVYPITTYTSSLMTSTNDELTAIIREAQSLNMTTILTPMIDPNYDLPGNCRQCKSPPGPGWRGTVGQAWGEDCSNGTQWAQWHSVYDSMILHYAQLAADTQVDVYLISHELSTATAHCPNIWRKLIRDVRAIFPGKVSVAFNGPFVSTYESAPWASELDWIGIDCYYKPDVTAPPLPWHDATKDTIKQAWQPIVAELAKVSQHFSKDVVCTEVGYQSRPWTYANDLTTPSFVENYQLCSEDCSVWDQCFSMESQRLGYQAMMEALYEQPWFKGFLLWMWRSDPSAGGSSDDSFTAAGKSAISILTSMWLPPN